MGYLKEGIVVLEELQLPSGDRLQKGPVAIIECVQKIPCNPCVDSCPQNAITMAPSINDVPEMHFKKCTGCGLCIANCPGLAIFLIDQSYGKDRALIGLPYEFLPLPQKGETVVLLDRGGQPVGEGEISRVRNSKTQDRTPIVFIVVPKSLAMTVRHFKRKNHG